VGIEGGAEAVQEGDGAELGASLPRQQTSKATTVRYCFTTPRNRTTASG
jgi:hypothetical protein